MRKRFKVVLKTTESDRSTRWLELTDEFVERLIEDCRGDIPEVRDIMAKVDRRIRDELFELEVLYGDEDDMFCLVPRKER